MRPTVLFVDDEEHVLSSLSRLFRAEPIQPLQAGSGDEALGLLETREVAVLVSDHRMPGMGGVELLSRVRRVSPATVKILLTGHADLETAIAAVNRGEVYRILLKPWDDTELTRTVREAAERYRVVRSLKEGDEAKLRSLAQAIELKDAYTRGHCDRVARYALAMADALGLDEAQRLGIKHGSWLHDCGKIGVPEAILNKPGALTEEEFAVIRRHPEWGADVATQARLSPIIVRIILHHHEHYDGSGYPSGLSGEEIPVEARIVAIADVFDALVTDRPYRRGYSQAKAKAVLRSMGDSHLDKRLVEAFLPLLERVSAGRRSRCDKD